MIQRSSRQALAFLSMIVHLDGFYSVNPLSERTLSSYLTLRTPRVVSLLLTVCVPSFLGVPARVRASGARAALLRCGRPRLAAMHGPPSWHRSNVASVSMHHCSLAPHPTRLLRAAHFRPHRVQQRQDRGASFSSAQIRGKHWTDFQQPRCWTTLVGLSGRLVGLDSTPRSDERDKLGSRSGRWIGRCCVVARQAGSRRSFRCRLLQPQISRLFLAFSVSNEMACSDGLAAS